MVAMRDVSPLPGAAQIAVRGPETAAFLDRLLTVSVSKLGAIGEALLGALLTPQGKVQHALYALKREDGVVLLLPDGAGKDALLKRLSLMKLRADVTLTDLETADDAEDLQALAHAWEASGVLPPTDPAERIRAGYALQGADYPSETVFPTDVNMDWLGGVDYAKGCFIGQEVASRMKRRGTIRKRTLVLTLDGADAVPAKSEVTAEDGTRLGETLSSAGGYALAVLRVDRLADAGGWDALLTVGDARATAALPAYAPEDAEAALFGDGATA